MFNVLGYKLLDLAQFIIKKCFQSMNSILYKCITQGDMANLHEIISVDLLLQETTGNRDTSLHVAVQYEKINIIQVLCSTCPELLLRVNVKEDTALHMAAREGLTEIVEVLLSCAELLVSDIESGSVSVHPKQVLVRMGNNEMDTALHEAVRNDHISVVNLLIDADPEFGYFANKSQKTPLYLAVEQGSHNMVMRMLENRSFSAHGGPDGTTVLHAVVIRGALSKQKDFSSLKKMPGLIKEVFEKGCTASLHTAAGQSEDSIISKLLVFDKSIGYVAAGNDGSTALHVAASKGNVKAMKIILQHCPDSWGMLNKKFQNILHIAAESKMSMVVKYIFQSSMQMVKSLVNAQDIDGNTPFHLAAKTYTEVSQFKGSEIVKKTIKNKQNLSALDMLGETIKRRGKLGYEEDDPWSDKEVQRLKEHAQPSLVVAGLLVTLTFTAGLTLPGGFIQDGKNKGKSTLLADGAFRSFVITNCIALASSFYGMTMYYYYMVLIQTKKAEIIKVYYHGIAAVSFSLGMLPFAFIYGCYSVLDAKGRYSNQSTKLATAVQYIIVAEMILVGVRLCLSPWEFVKDPTTRNQNY